MVKPCPLTTVRPVWPDWATNSISKEAQIFVDIFGYFENIIFELKTRVAALWAIIEKLGCLLFQHHTDHHHRGPNFSLKLFY